MKRQHWTEKIWPNGVPPPAHATSTPTAPQQPPKQALLWRVIAERTTVYEVQAATADEAIDLMIGGLAKEVDGDTTRLQAEEIRLCPVCQDDLTDRTTCNGKPTYCDTCDREVEHDEEGNV